MITHASRQAPCSKFQTLSEAWEDGDWAAEPGSGGAVPGPLQVVAIALRDGGLRRLVRGLAVVGGHAGEGGLLLGGQGLQEAWGHPHL